MPRFHEGTALLDSKRGKGSNKAFEVFRVTVVEDLREIFGVDYQRERYWQGPIDAAWDVGRSGGASSRGEGTCADWNMSVMHEPPGLSAIHLE